MPHWTTPPKDYVGPEDVELTDSAALGVLQEARGSETDASLDAWWDAQQRDEEQAGGQRSIVQSWSEVAKVVYSSLRTSALYFDNVSFDAVAFGCVAVARKHMAECDALPPLRADSGATRTGAAGGHDDLAAVPASVMRPWLPLLHNCTVMYDTPTSAARLASILGTEAASIVSFEPKSVPLCPAYYVAVDRRARSIDVVVRGTSALHDIVADVCGHCEPFFGGHAHFGMLRAAQFILAQELTRLQAVCRSHPGFTLHCYGHSLGGGIAALVAVTLRNSPGLLDGLGNPTVAATTFGAPPVLSAELAKGCRAYITSVINAHDMVACLSTHHLKQLASEMDDAKGEPAARGGAALGAFASQALSRSPMLSFAAAAGAAWASSMLSSQPDPKNGEAAAAVPAARTSGGGGGGGMASQSPAPPARSKPSGWSLLASAASAAAAAAASHHASLKGAPAPSAAGAADNGVPGGASGQPQGQRDMTSTTEARPPPPPPSSSFFGSWGSFGASAAEAAGAPRAGSSFLSSSSARLLSSVATGALQAAASAAMAGAPDTGPVAGGNAGGNLGGNTGRKNGGSSGGNVVDGDAARALPQPASGGIFSAGGGVVAMAPCCNLPVSGGSLELDGADATGASVFSDNLAFAGKEARADEPPPVPLEPPPSRESEVHVPLCVAGEACYLERLGDGHSAAIRCVRGHRVAARLERLLLKRTMLTDHFLRRYDSAVRLALEQASTEPQAENHMRA